MSVPEVVLFVIDELSGTLYVHSEVNSICNSVSEVLLFSVSEVVLFISNELS